MKNVNTHKQAAIKSASHGQQRSYNELVEYLDTNWSTNKDDNTLSCIKQLDQAFSGISQKLNTILITGSNGKSLTAHFTEKLLREEGLSVGTFYSPHLLTYNERFSYNDEVISNKTFTDLGNEVINTATAMKISPNSFDILTMMALLYFEKKKVDVVILEANENIKPNAVAICKSKVTAVTRVTEPEAENNPKETIESILTFVQPGTHVVSADQSKANLQIMQDITTQKGAEWSMPIRKLAQLSYPFEQLHGRCAALAERIAFIYINTFANQDIAVVNNSLLAKQKGQRGRPTLEAKRQSELNPKKTTEQFWKETHSTLPGRFQLLDKEKPTVLLDNASTIDAFKNVLLGARLLHYQRPLKGLTVILGCNNNSIDISEFLKLLRYFFKKTSGQVIVCPIEPLPGHHGNHAWDVEKVTNDIKSMKIKAKSAKGFKEAFEMAQKTVDTRYGLVVITGSSSIVTEYWKYKGIKKI